ncbi:MAG: hypothetical protein ABI151_08110 [Chitinophagaceae bacterium]
MKARIDLYEAFKASPGSEQDKPPDQLKVSDDGVLSFVIGKSSLKIKSAVYSRIFFALPGIYPQSELEISLRHIERLFQLIADTQA